MTTATITIRANSKKEVVDALTAFAETVEAGTIQGSCSTLPEEAVQVVYLYYHQ